MTNLSLKLSCNCNLQNNLSEGKILLLLIKRNFVTIIDTSMNNNNKITSIIILLTFIWCIGIIAAPILKHFGYNTSSNYIYKFYSHICHQKDSRSFHIHDNKFSVCYRCSSIYFGFLIGVIGFYLTKKITLKHINFRKLIIISISPMLIDIFLTFTHIHKSNAITKVISGAFFGFLIPLIVVPLFIEAYDQLTIKNKLLKNGVYSNDGETK